MTDNEKMIWAAVYAIEWSKALENRTLYGVPMQVDTCVENAAHAVLEAREANPTVKADWGDDNVVFRMLAQMCGYCG